MKTTQELIKSIVTPDGKYRPVMMWFWNGDITEEGIEEVLDLFKSQNITDFFVHPSEGMGVEYLSDRFMELISHAVAYAKKNGMHFWIYDEYNWPSGAAGEKILIEHPEYHARHVIENSVCVEEGALAEVPCDIFLAAQYEQSGILTDITDECFVKGGKCYWKNATGQKVTVTVQTSVHFEGVFAFARGYYKSRQTSGSVDYTQIEATRCFIDYTHERYKEYIGDEFGTTVPGVFTDEPSNNICKYTISDSILEVLKENYGPDPQRYFYLLFREGNDAIAFRRDYYEALSSLFHKNFIRPIADWCENNGLLLTGHLNGEENSNFHIVNGEPLNVLKSFGVPGIDLIRITIRQNWPDFNTLMATAQNINHFSGKNRLLSETYTVSTWSLSMAFMRRMASRLIMHGVNMLQFMGSRYTFSGIKTVHAGPDNGVHNILFPYYHVLGDGVARLSALTAETVPNVKVMVLHPLTSFGEQRIANVLNIDFAEFPDNHGEQVEATLNGVINSLSRLNIGYELIFESQLKDEGVCVKNGKICIPNPDVYSDIATENEYEMVILPMISGTHGYTRTILEKFVSEGGKLIFVNDAPSYNIDDFTPYNLLCPDEFRDASKKLQKNELAKGTTVRGRTDEGIFTILSNEVSPMGTAFCDAVSECMDEAGVEDSIDIDAAPDIYSTRRIGIGENGKRVWYFYLSNYSSQSGVANVRVNTGLPCLVLNTEGVCLEKTFISETSITIPGCGCRVIVSADEKTLETFHTLPFTPDFSSEKEVPMESFNFKAMEPNTLRLDFDEYTDSGIFEKMSDEEIVKTLEKASDDKFRVLERRLNADIFARTAFNVEQPIKNLKVVAENICDIRLWLNGKELTGGEEKMIVNEPYVVFDVDELCQTGKNTVVLRCKTKQNVNVTPCLLPFVVLAGDFVLDKKNTLITRNAPVYCKGLWTDMGYPQYSGTCSYELDLTGEETSPAAIRFESPDSMRVFADDVLIGETIGAPHEFLIPEGTRVVRAEVTGMLHNLYYGTDKPRIDEINNGGTIPSGIVSAKLLYR